MPLRHYAIAAADAAFMIISDAALRRLRRFRRHATMLFAHLMLFSPFHLPLLHYYYADTIFTTPTMAHFRRYAATCRHFFRYAITLVHYAMLMAICRQRAMMPITPLCLRRAIFAYCYASMPPCDTPLRLLCDIAAAIILRLRHFRRCHYYYFHIFFIISPPMPFRWRHTLWYYHLHDDIIAICHYAAA